MIDSRDGNRHRSASVTKEEGLRFTRCLGTQSGDCLNGGAGLRTVAFFVASP